MPNQQKSARQQQKPSHPDMNEDGLVELNEKVLEVIVGGKGAMAQDQIIQAEIATLKSSHTSPQVVDVFQNNNVGVSQAKNGNIRTH